MERPGKYRADSAPVYKRRSRQPRNYRGVCLLAMISRIVARVIAKRLRNWILDNNQSGFRPGRCTADATQAITRIQGDMQYIRARRAATNHPEDGNEQKGRLLDLEKAYPRVSKPALWQILERFGFKGNVFDTIKDLNEATSYAFKSREGDSGN